MSYEAYLSIGSNLGDRIDMCRRAVGELEKSDGIIVVSSSSLYETEPVGLTSQPRFINLAIRIETELTPCGLLEMLKDIERKLGRVDTFRWGPRTIDIDILLYGSQPVSVNSLKIPHPEMHERAFVLVPLSEIGADLIHPLTGKTVSRMLAELYGTDGVKKLSAKAFGE